MKALRELTSFTNADNRLYTLRDTLLPSRLVRRRAFSFGLKKHGRAMSDASDLPRGKGKDALQVFKRHS